MFFVLPMLNLLAGTTAELVRLMTDHHPQHHEEPEVATDPGQEDLDRQVADILSAAMARVSAGEDQDVVMVEAGAQLQELDERLHSTR